MDMQKLLMLKASSRPKRLWLGKISEVPRLGQNLLSDIFSSGMVFNAAFLEYLLFTYVLHNRPFPWKPMHSFKTCLLYNKGCTHHAIVLVKEILFVPLLLYFNNALNTIIYSIHSFQHFPLGPHLARSEISELVRLTNLR